MATSKSSEKAGLWSDFMAYLRLLAEPVLLYHNVWPFSGLREDEFRKAVVHWREGCIDTTTWALQALSDLDVERFGEYVTEPKSGEIVAFLKRHFDHTIGGFRQSAGLPASVYATHMAFNLAKFLRREPMDYYEQPLGKARAIEVFGSDGREIVERSVNFVLAQQDRTTGGFFNTQDRHPEELVVSIAHGACGLLWNLESLNENSKDGLVEFLISEDEGRSVLALFEEDVIGFKESLQDEVPLSCSTYYALRILQLLGEEAWIESRRPQLTGFLLACYERKDSLAGFRPDPSKHSHRTLSHTCMALAALVDILGDNGLPVQGSRIDLRNIRNYMNACKSTHGGFGFGRGPQVAWLDWILKFLAFRGRWYSPNVYMVRNVLATVKLLEPLDPHFSEVTEDSESLLRVIDDAHLRKNGAICWAGYPVHFFASKEDLEEAGLMRRTAYRLALAVRRIVVDLPLFPRARTGTPEFYSALYMYVFLPCLLLACAVAILWVIGVIVGLGRPELTYFAMGLVLAFVTIALVGLSQLLTWRAMY